MENKKNNNNFNTSSNFGTLTRCRGYVKNNRFIKIPLSVDLVDAVEVKKFDGSTMLVELDGSIGDGYKFTTKNTKTGKSFTHLISVSDIVQHQGHLIYLDSNENPHKLPESREKIKILTTEEGHYYEVVGRVNCSKYSYPGKDGKMVKAIIPNSEIVMAQELTNAEGRVLGYIREKDMKR